MQISAFDNAVLGIQRGMRGLERNAAELASAKQMEGRADPTQPLVETRINSLDAQANVKVLKTADEVMGTLLDVLA